VLLVAAFVVVAVQYSDFGKGGTTTLDVTGAAPPPATASPIAVRLSNAIGRASLGPAHRSVDMGVVAPFAWDRFHVFASQTSVDIRRALGFDWKGAPETVPRSGRHESLLVFVRGQDVAGSAFFSDAIGRLDCLVNDAGYPRGTQFLVRYSKKKEPYLTTMRPRGAERQCLVAAGVSLAA
jgi:hypothetical protein